jgi:hypothetical protein
LDATLEALDPLEQGARVVVDLWMGESHDGHLESDPRVKGVAHRHQGSPEHFHRPDAAGRPQEEPGLGWRAGCSISRGEPHQELFSQLVEKPTGYSCCVAACD